MSGPGGFVNPSNSAFAGGSYTPAGQPTAASGSFTAPSVSSGLPTNIGTPAAAYARNNRGSNIRIPYARVVNMHGRDQLYVEDGQLIGTGRSMAYEYDGLESGELAWIMSKQFVTPKKPNEARLFPNLNPSVVELFGFASNLVDTSRAANTLIKAPPTKEGQHALGPQDASIQAYNQGPGMGFGPDRLQRLAYTNWVEAFFKQRIARQTIDLTTLRIDDATGQNKFLDSEIAYFGDLISFPTIKTDRTAADNEIAADAARQKHSYLSGATVLCAPDLAYALQATPANRKPSGSGVSADTNVMQVQVPMMQGLFLMEMGPFLRSYGAEHYPVDIRLPIDAQGVRQRYWVTAQGAETAVGPRLAEVDRHLGSDLAQRALVCALKKHGVFNWTPDGVVLSKYATGPNPQSDAELDARSAMLFNVGVQGPCITKTWCGHADHQVLPMDKVFIVVVGEINYEVGPRTTFVGAGPNDAAKHSEAYDEDPGTTIGLRGAAAAAADALLQSLADVTRLIQSENFKKGTTQKPFDLNRNTYAAVAGVDADAARMAVFKKCNLASGLLTALTTAVENYTVTNPSAVTTHFNKLVETLNTLDTDMEPTIFEAYKEVVNLQIERMRMCVGEEARKEVGDEYFKMLAGEVRNGDRSIVRAELRNMRLMRATSSYLSQFSNFDPNEKPAKITGAYKSRCGLKIGFQKAAAAAVPGVAHPARKAHKILQGGIDPGADPKIQGGGGVVYGIPDTPDTPARVSNSGCAEYILGGWCVGTVCDSAASRALGHNGIRTAPASMAINVNVNVEWWNGDQLYQHYQDFDRGVYVQNKDVDYSKKELPNLDAGPDPKTPKVTDPAAPAPIRIGRLAHEGSVKMRTVHSQRQYTEVRAELEARKNLNGKQPLLDASKLDQEARLRINEGVRDFEGSFKAPDLRGVDTDAPGWFSKSYAVLDIKEKAEVPSDRNKDTTILVDETRRVSYNPTSAVRGRAWTEAGRGAGVIPAVLV